MSPLAATMSHSARQPLCGRDAGGAVAQRLDLRDRIVQPQRAAEPLELRDHARDQPVGAALREPHAAVALQLVDQRIDRAGRHRIAADQQRVEADSASRSFSDFTKLDTIE